MTENLAFAAKALGRPIEEIGAVLERVGLVESRRHAARSSSSAGQRRRLGLAWLLLRRPELWLLDEPYASLDDEGRTFFDQLIGDVVAGGATVVVSAHDPLRIDGTALRARSPWPAASSWETTSVIRTALLVAGKDLRIERRSRVLLWQVLPFGVMALRAQRPRPRARPRRALGRRARAVLPGHAARDLADDQPQPGDRGRAGTRASVATLGLDPAGVFLGKALALAVELWLTGVVLLAGAVLVLHTALVGTLEALPSVVVTLGGARGGGHALRGAERGRRGRGDAAAGPLACRRLRRCSSRGSGPSAPRCTAGRCGSGG